MHKSAKRPFLTASDSDKLVGFDRKMDSKKTFLIAVEIVAEQCLEKPHSTFKCDFVLPHEGLSFD